MLHCWHLAWAVSRFVVTKFFYKDTPQRKTMAPKHKDIESGEGAVVHEYTTNEIISLLLYWKKAFNQSHHSVHHGIRSAQGKRLQDQQT
jgi:hypothetical protein